MKYIRKLNPLKINDPQVIVSWDANKIPISLLPLP